MAQRRGAQRPPLLPKVERRFPLNTGSAPRSEREWIVYRAGVLEGIELAQADAREKAEHFMTRATCNGVPLSTPSAAAALQTSAAFTPQLRKRRTA